MKTLSEIIMEEFIMGALRTIPKRVEERIREFILNKFIKMKESTSDENLINALNTLYFELTQSELK